MKSYQLKKSGLAIAIVLAASVGTMQSISAAPPTATVGPSAKLGDKESQSLKQKFLGERQVQVEHEALEAIAGTQNALIALQKQDSKKTKALLQEVSGKLDIVLAKYPDLELIPANVEADVNDFELNGKSADVKDVQTLLNQTDTLLAKHKVQDARKILDQLVSEVRITTTSIPLGTFPAAIKDIIALIDKGKMDEAKTALYETLNTLVDITEMIPLPLLRAESMLTEASELEHKEDLSQQASREAIQKLTNDAKSQLLLAETLGYGEKEDYKLLYTAIDDIKDVIHSKKSAAAWDKVKSTFLNLKNKVIHPEK
ncbi:MULTISPECIES: YfdX family protein [Methylomicrobium]|uniref:YfdX protein n=1 Tax=Methylomicrobium album BG8 TaxID=686340 RepID=H8GL76_METAL|nr:MULTISPECIES: YfdX family protein [Methylomicrobium]EIC28075.1 YfdX protein [Methylomicrobium album BG8]